MDIWFPTIRVSLGCPLAGAKRSCPRKNISDVFPEYLPSIQQYLRDFFQAERLSLHFLTPYQYFFPFIFPITFWIQYSAATSCIPHKNSLSQIPYTERHVLCFDYITCQFYFMFCCFGMGNHWHLSSPIILDLSKCLLKIQDYCQMGLLHARSGDSFKAPGLGSQWKKRMVHISIQSELVKYTKFITMQPENKKITFWQMPFQTVKSLHYLLNALKE